MTSKKPPDDPNDPHAMFGQLRALIESVRLEMHDALLEMRSEDTKEESKGLKDGDISGLLSAVSLVEARIQAGEQQAAKALEPLKAAIEKDSANDEAVAKALCDLCTKTQANTDAILGLTAAFKDLSKTLGKKRTRTGTVQLPDGPVTMTVTEH